MFRWLILILLANPVLAMAVSMATAVALQAFSAALTAAVTGLAFAGGVMWGRQSGPAEQNGAAIAPVVNFSLRCDPPQIAPVVNFSLRCDPPQSTAAWSWAEAAQFAVGLVQVIMMLHGAWQASRRHQGDAVREFLDQGGDLDQLTRILAMGNGEAARGE